MTYHITETGYITLQDTWGHGKAPKRNWNTMPTILIEDDGDGHYSAWKVYGTFHSAAVKLANLCPRCGALRKAILHRNKLFYEDVSPGEIIQHVELNENGDFYSIHYATASAGRVIAVV